MYSLLENAHAVTIFIVFCISLFFLSKAADYLVDNAVMLSKMVGLSEIIIGATIVSLGTTLPELSASVSSALGGNGSFALGNAVGSIIANTSLILGIGTLFGKIPVKKKSVQRFNFLIGAVILLVLSTLPNKVSNGGSHIPQGLGFVYLVLTVLYIGYLIYSEKKSEQVTNSDTSEGYVKTGHEKVSWIVLAILISALIIAVSSSVLVTSAEVLAVRLGVSDVIIASTLVAFGTSVPELTTCITATKKGHGDLAFGNIMGADVLNILLVTGASIAVSPGGIDVAAEFFSVHFVALAVVLAVLGLFIYKNKTNELSKGNGITLMAVYILYLYINLYSL